MFNYNMHRFVIRCNSRYNVSTINRSLNTFSKTPNTRILYINDCHKYHNVSIANKRTPLIKSMNNVNYKMYAFSTTSNLNKSIESLNMSPSDKTKYELWYSTGKRFLISNMEKDTNNLIADNVKIDELINLQNQRLLRMCSDYKQYGMNIPATLLRHRSLPSNNQGIQDSPPTDVTSSEYQCLEGDQDCEARQKYLRLCRHFEFRNSDQCVSNLYEADGNAAILLAETKLMLDDLVVHCDTMEKENGQMTNVQKLRQAVRDYGSVVVVFHVSLSLTSLGICYTAINYGIDLPSIIQKAGLLDESSYQTIIAGASTFVISYAVHKIFAPVRIGITLASVPFIVKKLRNSGILSIKK